jgi:hypothetical protein
MNSLTETVTTIALAIVGLAIIATLVGKNARTSQVIDSGSKGFFTSLATAMGPVTGFTPSGGNGFSTMPNSGLF